MDIETNELVTDFRIRGYQDEIFAHACQSNTLAFLPTGSGKTFISVLLIKHYVDIIRADVMAGKPKKLIAFIAPTKILVHQQKNYLAANVNAVVREYSSDAPTQRKISLDGEAPSSTTTHRVMNNWSKSHWENEAAEVDIIVCTPEILRQVIQKSFLQIKSFALVIIDECHNCTGDSPMAVICEEIKNCEKPKPRVLALTASPMSTKKGDVRSKIEALEGLTGCTIVAQGRFLNELSAVVSTPMFYCLKHSAEPFRLSQDKGFTDLKSNVVTMLESIASRATSFGSSSTVTATVTADSSRGSTFKHPDSVPFHDLEASPGCGLRVGQDTVAILMHAYCRLKIADHVYSLYKICKTLKTTPEKSCLMAELNLPDKPSKNNCRTSSNSKWSGQILSRLGQVACVLEENGLLCSLYALESAMDWKERIPHDKKQKAPSKEKDNGEVVSDVEMDIDLPLAPPVSRKRPIADSGCWVTRVVEDDEEEEERRFRPRATQERKQQILEERQRIQSERANIDSDVVRMMKAEILGSPFHKSQLLDNGLVYFWSIFDFFAALITACGTDRIERVVSKLDDKKSSHEFFSRFLKDLLRSLYVNPKQYIPVGCLRWWWPQNHKFDVKKPSIDKLREAVSKLTRLFIRSFTIKEVSRLIIAADPNIYTEKTELVESELPAESFDFAFPPCSSSFEDLMVIPDNTCDSHLCNNTDIPSSDIDDHVNEILPHSLISSKVRALLQNVFARDERAKFLLKQAAVIEGSEFCDQYNSSDDQLLPINWSAIVFCRLRASVYALHALLRDLLIDMYAMEDTDTGETDGSGIGFNALHPLRPVALFGIHKAGEQSKALSGFRSGKFNLMFATDIAEEGLDIRACQLVIHFDLPSTVKSFIQRRGRARARNSSTVALIEHGVRGERDFHDLVSFNTQEKEMQSVGCEVDYSNELLSGPDINGDFDMDDDEDFNRLLRTFDPFSFLVSESGAKCDGRSAVALLYHYCQQLPHDGYFVPAPIYWTFTCAPEFISPDDIGLPMFKCALLLPASVPSENRCLLSPACPSKKIAKGAVCVEAVRHLYHRGELNEWLLAVQSKSAERARQDEQQRMNKINTKDVGDIATNLQLKKTEHQAMLQENKPTIEGLNEHTVKIATKFAPAIFSAHLASVTDTSTAHPPLYLYSFEPEAQSADLPKLHACPLCSRHFSSISAFGVAYLSPLPENEDYVISICINDINVKCRVTNLGRQDVSGDQIAAMQKFHRSLLCWEFVAEETESVWMPPGDWAASSNGFWSTIFPIDTTATNTADLLNVEFLRTAASDAQTLTRNLLAHRSKLTVSFELRETKVQWVGDKTHADLNETMFTTGIAGALYFGFPDTTSKSLTDSMVYQYPHNPDDPVEVTDVVERELKENTTPTQNSSTFVEHYLARKIFEQPELDHLLSIPNHKLVSSIGVSPELTLIPLIGRQNVCCNSPGLHGKNCYSVTHHIPEYCTVLGKIRWAMVGLLAPSFLWEINDLVIAIEARSLTIATIQTYLCQSTNEVAAVSTFPKKEMFLESITPRMAHKNFDSERIEFFGDSFLKMATSIEVFEQFPSKHEGFLTFSRATVISNDHISTMVMKHGLTPFIRALSISNGKKKLKCRPPGRSSSWDKCLWNQRLSRKPVPTGEDLFIRDQADAKEPLTLMMHIKTKVLADAFEALLGCYYFECGSEEATTLCKAFGVWPDANTTNFPSKITTLDFNDVTLPVKEEIISMEELPSEKDFKPPEGFPVQLARIAFGPLYDIHDEDEEGTGMGNLNLGSHLSRSESRACTLRHLVNTMKILIGYEFKNMLLLEEALTHCSISYRKSNQRLEFLGDAVLDFAVVTVIYARSPPATQGEMSQEKSNLTTNKRLGYIGFKLGLHKLLYTMSPPLQKEFNEISNAYNSMLRRNSTKVVLEKALDSSLKSETFDIRATVNECMFSMLDIVYARVTNNRKRRSRWQDNNKRNKRFRKDVVQCKSSVSNLDEEAWFLEKNFNGLKAVADAVEALIGAVYLDSDKSLEVVSLVVKKIGIISPGL